MTSHSWPMGATTARSWTGPVTATTLAQELASGPKATRKGAASAAPRGNAGPTSIDPSAPHKRSARAGEPRRLPSQVRAGRQAWWPRPRLPPPRAPSRPRGAGARRCSRRGRPPGARLLAGGPGDPGPLGHQAHHLVEAGLEGHQGGDLRPLLRLHLVAPDGRQEAEAAGAGQPAGEERGGPVPGGDLLVLGSPPRADPRALATARRAPEPGVSARPPACATAVGLRSSG
jgi:hypothetical protein